MRLSKTIHARRGVYAEFEITPIADDVFGVPNR